MYVYPYGDSQQLNLDWIINKLKELEAESAGNVDLKTVSEALISLTYNPGTLYVRDDYAFLNGKLYRCLSNTSGAFDPDAWQEALIGEDLTVLTRGINAINAAINSLDSNFAPVLSSMVADTNLVIGDLRIYDHALYRITNPITQGNAITVGTNAVKVDLTNLNASGADNFDGYCKMADGTLIQWGKRINQTVVIDQLLDNGMYRGTYTLNYPIPVINNNSVVIGGFQYGTGTGFPFVSPANGKTPNSAILNFFDFEERNGNQGRFDFFIIGRWKQ